MTRISGAGRGGGQVGAAGGERGGAVGALLPEPGYPPRGARRPRPLGPPGSRPPGCLRRLQGAFRYCHVNSTSEAMPFRCCCLRGLEGASGAFRCCRVSLLSRGARRPRPLGPPGSRLRRLQGAVGYCHAFSLVLFAWAGWAVPTGTARPARHPRARRAHARTPLRLTQRRWMPARNVGECGPARAGRPAQTHPLPKKKG